MKLRYTSFIPGENTRVIFIAAFIGLIAGVLNIVFRTIVHKIDEIFFVGGKALLGIDQGGWHLLLLPLIPISGMVLLIPLSLLFPGEVNGYGFTKFLRKVNLEGGYIRARTIFLKIISTALTIGTGNSAGVEGPIAQIGGAMGSQVGQFFKVSGNRRKVYSTRLSLFASNFARSSVRLALTYTPFSRSGFSRYRPMTSFSFNISTAK